MTIAQEPRLARRALTNTVIRVKSINNGSLYYNEGKQTVLTVILYFDMRFAIKMVKHTQQIAGKTPPLIPLTLAVIQRTKMEKHRLPENSRNRFVDRQFKKTVKKTDQKNSSFH